LLKGYDTGKDRPGQPAPENGETVEASYLITVRDTDGTRFPLLGAVLAWLAEMPALEVIVVEQDAETRAGSLGPFANVEWVYVQNAGPFNKSWGLNIAARRARGELLVTGDADMILPGTALRQALAMCAERFDAVNPYGHIVDLTEAETRRFLRGSLDLGRELRQQLHDRVPQGEYLCFCGGICVFRRDVYFALGGMDERFIGWGGEDDAMSVNLGRFTDRLAVQKNAVAYHLYHPRAPDRYEHPHYRQNLERVLSYRGLTSDQLERLRGTNGATMGDSERFRGP